MDMHQNVIGHHHNRVPFQKLCAVVCTIAASLAFVGPLSATLIGDSLEYDGHVKSGASTGVEKHYAAPLFPPISATLAVTNGSLTSPLRPARALTITETEFADALNGQVGYQHVVITIQAVSSVDNAFVNPLDPTIALPILFDGFFHANNMGFAKKLDIPSIGIESFNLPPFPAPGSRTISGLGTVASPLHIQLGLAANQAPASTNGFVKIHLYYKIVTNPVPEPSTCALLLVGVVAIIGMTTRRQRG